MTPDEIRSLAETVTRRACEDLRRCASHLSAEQAVWTPGGVARNAIAIVAHCAVSCRFFAAVLQGQPSPYRTASDMEAAIQRCGDMERALRFLQEAVQALEEAIRALPDERLSSSMTMPWGESLEPQVVMLMPAMHLQYHLGQIAYLETAMGDDEVH